MPGVRSIISLAWTYPIRAIEPDEEKEAQVAGYAVGSDYHVSLFNMLKILAEYIRTELNTPAEMQGFTDSSAILEKEIASRAGLGWIGKNSCLISPKVGSSFLLAELFTTLPLTPDQPFRQDRCGTCHRCLDACPTGCILPERTLDVRKCLSYLTIENKGNIPEKMRALIGNWIFGCDICQMVCPWNRKFAAKKTKDQLINWTSDQVVEILFLSPEDFTIRFKDSAIFRTKWKGLVRNALIYLGNKEGRSSVPMIENFKKQIADLDLLETADWAIHQMNSKDVNIENNRQKIIHPS
jgi:epoxyqueuosine reductase